MTTIISHDINKIEKEIDRLTEKLCKLKQFANDFPKASQFEMNFFIAWLERSDLSYDEVIEKMKKAKN